MMIDRTTQPASIEPDKSKLARTSELAYRHLVDMLSESNELTREHKHALVSLVVTMTQMVFGDLRGRYCVGEPCGFGKTSAIVAMSLYTSLFAAWRRVPLGSAARVLAEISM